ncbi:MAG TPA: aminotransferase class III-fold pyridoxal phosphate-dependent enzyme, partial [Candidatus Polarisedimenticolia bacterium]|nr:aminotransferase class III-fold pyridoxal phosphate-dependent enzyme [Candidatus Polarisedimenticolia bacterium]
ANAGRVGAHLMKGLRGLQEKHAILGDVRGLGLMVGLEIVRDRATRAPNPEARHEILVQAFERGLLILPCGASTLRLSPPLVCTEQDADTAVAILDAACTAVAGARPQAGGGSAYMSSITAR